MANINKFFQEWWDSKFLYLCNDFIKIQNSSIRSLIYIIFTDAYYEGYEHGHMDGRKSLHKKTVDGICELTSEENVR